jgi:hypothetical protein
MDLTFDGPFEEKGNVLIASPRENGWVRITQAYYDIRERSATDKLYVQGWFTGERTPKGELADPYKIAFAIFVRDGQGVEHTVVDEVYDFQRTSFEFFIGGVSSGGGEPGFGGVYRSPIKLKDAVAIRVRLSKVKA